MIKFARYRPSTMLCATIVVSFFIILGIHEPSEMSTSAFVSLTVLKGIQFIVLCMTIFLELQIHANRKKRYYNALTHYNILLNRLQQWESDRFTPQMILQRYYSVFQYFETALKINQDRTYKKYTVKLEAIQGEYDRLKTFVNLDHNDLHDFKLSVKMLPY